MTFHGLVHDLHADGLERLVDYLPKEFSYAFEFRHASWRNKDVYEVRNPNTPPTREHHLHPTKLTAPLVVTPLDAPAVVAPPQLGPCDACAA
jgi:hypothetical protein